MKATTLMFAFAAALTASATDYTYKGTSTSWTDPDNWKPTGCPTNAADTAFFPSGTFAVSLDTGIQTDIKNIKAQSGADVTITATEGSSFAFAASGGPQALDGGKLTLDAPAKSVGDRFDILCEKTGEMHVKKIIELSLGANLYQATYFTYPGSVTFEGEGGLWDGDHWHGFSFGNGGAASDVLRISVKDQASVKSKSNFTFGVNKGDNPSIEFNQNGADTKVYAYGILMGYSGKYPCGNHYTYTLNDGELKLTDNGIVMYAGTTCDYVQNGGTATMPKIDMKSDQGNTATINGGTATITTLNITADDCLFVQKGGEVHLDAINITANGKVRLEGGTMYLPSVTCVQTLKPGQIELAGGTLVIADTSSGAHQLPAAFAVTGDMTLNVPSGATYGLGSMAIASGAVLTVTGGGTLSIASDFVGSGVEFVIGENSKLDICAGVLVAAKPGSYDPLKITVKDGATFTSATPSVHYAVPLDLALEGTGAISMPSGNRSSLVVHKLTTNGVVLAKGRYFPHASWNYPPAVMIPYIWTGNGDGTNWNDAANWDAGVPPSGDSAFADISRATEVNLASATTIRGVFAMPNNAEKKVTIKGKALSIKSATMHDGFYVSEGCELVLEAPVAQANSGAYNSINGGGTIRAKNSFPVMNNGVAFSLDGTVIFQNTSGNGTDDRYFYFTHEGTGKAIHEIATGAVWNSRNMYYIRSGYYEPYRIRQTGGSVTTENFRFSAFGNNSISDRTYHLDGGTMTVNKIFDLGVYTYNDGSLRKSYPGMSFEMTGGTLSVASVAVSCNQTYMRLKGGTVNLAGSMYRDFDTSKQENFSENTVPFEFGAITMVATGNASIDYNSQLTGVGGDFTFDTGAYDCYITNSAYSVSGEGGLVKAGSGTLTIGQTCAFTGALTVNAGTVALTGALAGPRQFVVTDAAARLAVSGTVTTAPKTIALKSAENLTLGSGVTMTVEKLTIDGVAQSGTVVFGEGSVTVTPREAWLDAEGNGDLSNVGAEQALTAPVTVATLVSAPLAGSTVTLKGTGANAVTFADGATIDVAPNTTLVIDADVTLAGRVNVIGAGTLQFAGAVTGADSDKVLAVNKGTTKFTGAVTVLTLATCGATKADMPVLSFEAGCTVSGGATVLTAYNLDASTACYGETVFNGATVDLTEVTTAYYSNNLGGYGKWTINAGTITTPANSAIKPRFLVGSGDASFFDIVQNGGTFNAQQGFYLGCATQGQYLTYTLNGGTFQTGGLIEASSGYPAVSHVFINGGTIETTGTITPFPSYLAGETSGTITFQQAAASDRMTFVFPVRGGTVVQQGPGILALAKFESADALTVEAGAVSLGTSAADGLVGTATVATDATLDLDYAGTLSAEYLVVADKSQHAGTCGANAGKRYVRNALTGTGTITVTKGSPRKGFLIIIK